ncbi:glycerol-3-phosphate dehydrogenase, partial [Burkholderia cenocepacia]|nr:glycerol-3-phosphate dehydrogenase [Burkholderia cenocepacia]
MADTGASPPAHRRDCVARTGASLRVLKRRGAGGRVVSDVLDHREKTMKVCVLGGGHGCHAAAIDLLEKGHDVTWWRRDREPHARLRELGVLNVTDYRGKRSVPLGDAPGAIRLT